MILLLSALIFVFVISFFFFSSRRRHTRYIGDWSSDVCSSDLAICSSGNDMVKYISAQLGLTPSPLLKAMQKTQEPRRKAMRSEERRVGKECRYRWSPDD